MTVTRKKAVFTSCNLDYLDRAIVLAETCKKYTLDVDFILILSDFIDLKDLGDFLNDKIFNKVIEPCDLGIDNFVQWSFRHTVVELCTAVKGAAFIHILRLGYEEVVYLDPDIACFSSLDLIYESLKKSSILLTPHQLTPAKTDRQFIDNELCSFQHGIYNLGFLAIKKSSDSEKLLGWWSERLYHHCTEAIERGIFTDQKWLDAAPAFFDDCSVLRHPGLNVASWNLCERILKIKNDRILVNGTFPLIFYHFTKYFGIGREMTIRYAQSTDVTVIWNWYGRRIQNARQRITNITQKGKYQYFKTGETITSLHRSMWLTILSQDNNCLNDPYESPACLAATR
jgi:hypothetical protein